MNNTSKKINIICYNCKNFKRNNLYLKELRNNSQICFITEHWLNSEENILMDDMFPNDNCLFYSDMDIKDSFGRRGRPYGGKCWLIDKSFEIIDYAFVNKDVSYVMLKVNNISFLVIGVYQPFDNGTMESYANIKSNMQLITTLCKDHNDIPTIIVGDFNSVTVLIKN